MTTALICIALLAMLLFGLGFNVSLVRGKTKVLAHVEPSPDSKIYKAHRAHGNTTEYAPIFAILFYVLGTMNPASWVCWFMIIATASRYIFVMGILSSSSMTELNKLRFIGSLGTYVSGLALSIALLIQVI